MLKCPHCGSENIRVVKVTYECNNAHTYSEEVELPKDPAERSLVTIPPRHDNKPIMSFGKHKGQFVEDLPTDYIEWCLGNLERIAPSIKKVMEEQLILRRGEGVSRDFPE